MSTSLNLAPELSVASTASPSLPLNGHSPALELSPRLHNRDLAPTRIEGRRWGRYSIFALWTNDVHNIANYSFAMGLFALGLGGWQILLSLAIGAALVYFFMNLSGYMGQKTGVPFPVISRIAFGIHGAQIPALIRAVIAIAWFGIQTYLASVVLRVLLHRRVAAAGRLRPQQPSWPVEPGLGVLRGDLAGATGDPCLRHGDGAPLRGLRRPGDPLDRGEPCRVDVLPGRCPHRLVGGRTADRL